MPKLVNYLMTKFTDLNLLFKIDFLLASCSATNSAINFFHASILILNSFNLVPFGIINYHKLTKEGVI